MSEFPEDNEVILVDFKSSGGTTRQVSLDDLNKQLLEQSQRALSATMAMIRVMGNRTIAAYRYYD